MNAVTTFGPAYDEKVDGKRIKGQQDAIREFMVDSPWYTLQEISQKLGYPEASVSAQLRHLRKTAFGGFNVDKRRRGNAWEYRVTKPAEENIQLSMFSMQA